LVQSRLARHADRDGETGPADDERDGALFCTRMNALHTLMMSRCASCRQRCAIESL
jgi:hypothetical protein